MNLHNTIVESLIRSAGDVFSTMLGSELSSGEVTVEAATSGAQRRRSLVHWHRRKLGRHRKLDLLTGDGLPYLCGNAHDRGPGRQ